jgi:hypothetical protein
VQKFVSLLRSHLLATHEEASWLASAEKFRALGQRQKPDRPVEDFEGDRGIEPCPISTLFLGHLSSYIYLLTLSPKNWSRKAAVPI